MLYSPWPHWIRWRTSHNQKLQYLSNSKTTRNSCCINLGLTGLVGVQLHLSVKVFTAKVLIVDTIFTSPAGDGTAMLRGHPSHAKVQPLEVQRDYLRFSVVFKRPWVMVHNRESNPRPPALQLCALPTELIPPVQSETQKYSFTALVSTSRLMLSNQTLHCSFISSL